MTSKQEQNTECNLNISKTGYRVLLLFKLLQERPRSRAEIEEAFAKDAILQKGVSHDSITNIVRALRKCGCVIKRPNISTQYKYVLEKHPFTTELNEKALDGLQKLRDGIASFGDWQLLYKVNKLYEVFAKFALNPKFARVLLRNHALRNIDYKILKKLVSYCGAKQTLRIKYISPVLGSETLTFIPDYVAFENNIMYLWGYNLRYKSIGYLRLDRIKRLKTTFYVNAMSVLDLNKSNALKVTYRLTGFSKLAFEPTRFEHVVIENPNFIVVEATAYNKFNLIQRLLSFGAECKVLTPSQFVEEYIMELKNIREIYRHEKQKNS